MAAEALQSITGIDISATALVRGRKTLEVRPFSTCSNKIHRHSASDEHHIQHSELGRPTCKANSFLELATACTGHDFGESCPRTAERQRRVASAACFQRHCCGHHAGLSVALHYKQIDDTGWAAVETGMRRGKGSVYFPCSSARAADSSGGRGHAHVGGSVSSCMTGSGSGLTCLCVCNLAAGPAVGGGGRGAAADSQPGAGRHVQDTLR